MRILLALLVIASSVASAAEKSEVTGANVLVVVNGSSAASRDLAKFYMSKRSIPEQNRCSINPSGKWMYIGALDWTPYLQQVRDPMRKCLEKVGKRNILYIVFSYDTPYVIFDSPTGHGAALDQYIADIWDESGPGGMTRNPYYKDANSRAGVFPPYVPLVEWRKGQTPTIYSVWHLEGETPAAARALVEKALVADQKGASGTVCIDRQYGDQLAEMPDTSYAAGDWDLFRAAELFRSAGMRVVEDKNKAEFGTPPAPERCDEAIFFAGWYSLSHYNDAFTWRPGAFGVHLDSNSATNLREGTNWVANALKKGITVATGSVAEPYLTGLPHPDTIAYVLLQGGHMGDALLASTEFLRWMIVNVGDPLYRPKYVPEPKASAGTK